MPRQGLGICVHLLRCQPPATWSTDCLKRCRLTALARSELSRQGTGSHWGELTTSRYRLSGTCTSPVDVTTSRGVGSQVSTKLNRCTSAGLYVRSINQSRSSNANVTDVRIIESHGNFTQGSTSSFIDSDTGYILTGSTITTVLEVESSSCGSQLNLSSSTVSDQSLGRTSEVDTLTDARTNGVVLVGRQGNCSQDADDRNHDHQFNQGKTFLSFHG